MLYWEISLPVVAMCSMQYSVKWTLNPVKLFSNYNLVYLLFFHVLVFQVDIFLSLLRVSDTEKKKRMQGLR